MKEMNRVPRYFRSLGSSLLISSCLALMILQAKNTIALIKRMRNMSYEVPRYSPAKLLPASCSGLGSNARLFLINCQSVSPIRLIEEVNINAFPKRDCPVCFMFLLCLQLVIFMEICGWD